MRGIVQFLAGSKYAHFALLRSQGSHRGIPGSHLDLRFTGKNRQHGRCNTPVDWDQDLTCLHRIQAVSVYAIRPSGTSDEPLDEGAGFHGLEKFGRDDGGLLWSAIAVPWTSILDKLIWHGSSGGGWHVDRLHWGDGGA